MLSPGSRVLAQVTLPDRVGWLGAAIVLLYAIALVVYDRYLSTRPSRTFLQGYMESLRNSAGLPRPPNPGPDIDRRDAEINRRVQEALTRMGAKPPWWTPVQTSVVLSLWREAHRIERLAWRNADPAEAWEKLRSVRSDLARMDAEAQDVATRIAETIGRLSTTSPNIDPGPLLQQALTILHDRRDLTFESLADLQMKSAWLALLGLALIVLASAGLHREVFFILGALGGFLSRLGRLLRRRPRFTDYGASSSQLLLAPVAGALAGWVGVLLVDGLAQVQAVDSETFRTVWERPLNVLPSALAFLFGFSERFLDRAVSTFEEAVVPAQTDNTPQ